MTKISCRKAELEDAHTFNRLISISGGQAIFKSWFGQYNYATLIEYSYLSLIFCDGEEEPKCFMALNDSASSSDLQFYEDCLIALKDIIDCKVTNTMFINFWALDERQDSADLWGKEMLQTSFKKCPDLDYIVWFCPISAKIPDFISRLFIEKDLSSYKNYSKNDLIKGYKACYVERTKFLPRLFVREARVEDFDDLLPILKASNSQGDAASRDDYFLADLIESQDERSRLFVGVDQDRPIGMLATNVDVNIDLMERIFDLEAFANVVITNAEIPQIPCFVIFIVGSPIAVNTLQFRRGIIEDGIYHINASVLFGASSLSEVDKLNLIQKELDSVCSNAGDIAEAVRFITVFVCGYLKDKDEARALANSGLKVDGIIELGPRTDNDDITDEQINDTVEFLKDIIQRDSQRDNLNVHANSETEGVRLNFQPLWSDVNFDEESGHVSVEDRILESIKELQNLFTNATIKENDDSTFTKSANAFVITSFCIDPLYEAMSEELLRVSFEDHPDLDYCLMMLPIKSPPPPLVFWMSPVSTRTGVSFDQTLYLLNRDALLAHDFLAVSRLSNDWVPEVETFLAPLGDDGESVIDAVRSSLTETDVELKDNPNEASFVVHMKRDVLGVVVVSRKYTSADDINWVRANYQIDEVISFDRHRGRSVAMITNWILNPIYSRWTKFILREIMRLYHKTLLLFQPAKLQVPPVEVTYEMTPIKPRQRMDPSPDETPNLVSRPTPYASGRESPLFVISKRMLSESRTLVETRVVLVGGNGCTFPFLESLCYAPGIHLRNIYLVLDRPPEPWLLLGQQDASTDQRPSGSHEDSIPSLRKISGCLSGPLSVSVEDEPSLAEVYALGLANRTTLIIGRLQDIDRENKTIVLSNGTQIEFDVLVLATGLQDTSILEFEAFNKMTCKETERFGLFCLGPLATEVDALVWIQEHESVDDDGVIIYGAGLDALNVAGRLLESGIAPSRITWVIPSSIAVAFGSAYMDEAVSAALAESKINVFFDSTITGIGQSNSGNVENVVVAVRRSGSKADRSSEGSSEDTVVISCSTILTVNKMQCDVDVFSATNNSGLVFDGGLVVNAEFRTTDPNIYAMGSFSRFSRIHKLAVAHSSLNVRELASTVAATILDHHCNFRSDGTSVDSSLVRECQRTDSKLRPISSEYGFGKTIPVIVLPKFLQPKTVTVSLPGGLHYCRSAVPGTAMDESTVSLSTGDAGAENICIVKMDSLGIVVEITCLSTSLLPARNMGSMVGWHESHLNSLVFSFEAGYIPCLLEYFRSGWVSALCHDKFASFVSSLRAELVNDKGMLSILDNVMSVMESTDDDTVVVGERRRMLGDRGSDVLEPTKQLIESHTLEFIRKNKSLFTKFHLPVLEDKNKK